MARPNRDSFHQRASPDARIVLSAYQIEDVRERRMIAVPLICRCLGRSLPLVGQKECRPILRPSMRPIRQHQLRERMIVVPLYQCWAGVDVREGRAAIDVKFCEKDERAMLAHAAAL